jgi:hypothetical protein
MQRERERERQKTDVVHKRKSRFKRHSYVILSISFILKTHVVTEG